MPLKLEEAKDEDFLEICTAFCEAFEDPFEPYLRMLAPVIDNDRQATIKAYADRTFKEFKENPPFHWMKVVDTDDNNKIVAAAKWDFYTENPYTKEDEKPFEAEWWPEGPGRDLATRAILEVIGPRIEKSQRAHACMYRISPFTVHSFFLFFGYDVFLSICPAFSPRHRFHNSQLPPPRRWRASGRMGRAESGRHGLRELGSGHGNGTPRV